MTIIGVWQQAHIILVFRKGKDYRKEKKDTLTGVFFLIYNA
jgi:hypothetical protein